MKSLPYIIISVLFVVLFHGCYKQHNETHRAVIRQLQHYPESTLQDIYKSFFQDEFGPGHLIGDTNHAREYFDYELLEMTSSGNYIAEPCGTGHNFFRVPMDLVKDGKITPEDYFAAFIESASFYRIPEPGVWHEKWHIIVQEIEAMHLSIENFEQDKAALDGMLQSGQTAVHHSKVYSERYDPHYRIMGKAYWEKLKESL